MRRVLLTLCLSFIFFWLVFSTIPALATRSQKPRNIVGIQSGSSGLASATAVTYTYYSSVDGAALEYMEYLPAGYTASISFPLAIMLPGSGGNYQYNAPISPAAQVNELAVVLSGAWPFSATGAYSVTRDGAPLPPISFTFTLTRFTLQRQPVEAAHTYIIWPASFTNLVYLPLILR